MKKSKLIVSVSIILLIIAAGFIVNWKVFDFYTPAIQWVKKTVESEASEKPEDADKVDEPADANKPKECTDTNKPAAANEPNEPDKPAEPNEPMEALNLKNVEMKDIIQKIAQWTGKVIIPDDESMKQRITIYSEKELPRSQALSLIYSALYAKGFIAEHTETTIYLKPVKQARIGSVPTIPSDQPLASIENKTSIVQKFFKLKNYNPVQMSKILLPLIGDYGYVNSDESTGNLIVIDTVENLMRFEKIIEQFDVPGSEQAIERVFEIQHGDPSEIVQLLRKLLVDNIKGSASRSQPDKGKDGNTAESVIIESPMTPIVLIPEPKRKWIIARASAEDMRQIGDWIAKLDKVDKLESEYETISIIYVDPVEVAENLNQALQEMPGTELKKSIIVRPLRKARQIMVFGRAEMREMAKKFIAEIDIPPGQFETKVFQLIHADSDSIKENIDNLYEDINSGISSYRREWQSSRSAESVRTISFPTMHQVTVIASSENMRKIEKQIEEWDVPLDVKKVKPWIITLHNSDSVKIAELLTKMFTEEVSTRSLPWWWDDGGKDDKKKKIVGALYGQLTFQAVPDTKKIIVVSKIPEAYSVIQELVQEIDKQEMAEVPMVKVLKYGDPEEVCERLNAVFNITGTPASIRRSTHGLSEYKLEDTEDDTSRQSQDRSSTSSVSEYTPPWSMGRLRTDEMPVSNVIGKIRFIPDPRSKAIMVLAPPEHLPEISKMVEELDRPSKQVMVKAVILEVNHENMTSLGVRLSSNKAAFGDIGENAVTALTQAVFRETRGSFTIGVEANPMVLVDLLIKETQAKILNQPTLWTKDNEEAEFFKGTLVAFLTGDQTSSEGASITRTVDYRKVGVVLRVRPNITPERNVDMTIHLKVSQVLPELINNEVAIGELNTTTNLIVEDSETILLGGILFQTDTTVESKLPLIGDAPLVGGLFRHTGVQESNKELLVLITPYVIDAETKPSTKEKIDDKKEKMENVLEELNEVLNVNEQK